MTASVSKIVSRKIVFDKQTGKNHFNNFGLSATNLIKKNKNIEEISLIFLSQW